MITSAFTVLFTTLQIFYEYKSEKEELLHTYEIINDLYVAPLTESLWIMNKSIINTQAKSLLGYPYVSYVKIYDEDFNYFEKGNYDKKAQKNYDLKYGEQKIGSLIIGLNTSLLEEKFLRRVMVTVLIQGIKAIVVCIILFFAYELLITRSLRRVSNYLVTHPDATSKGEKIPFDHDRDDELGILVKNLNGFIEYIYGLNKSLKDLNNSLEKKVDERTHELKKKNRQLVEVIEDLETAHDQLAASEKLASLGKMTAGIAHEIKNPVYIVVNSVTLIKELIDELLGEIPDDVKKNIDVEITDDIKDLCQRSEVNCERVGNIINSMLSLSRTSDDSRETVEINSLIRSSIEFAYDAFKSKNNFVCNLTFDLDDEIDELEVYKTELSRSIINIVDNSFYSMKKKAEIIKDLRPELKVSVKNVDNNFQITISDNGEGISEEVKKNMFSPFFTTKPAGEGTGLGMSMTYDIVKKHGGEIELLSDYGHGATFIISLPKA